MSDYAVSRWAEATAELIIEEMEGVRRGEDRDAAIRRTRKLLEILEQRI